MSSYSDFYDRDSRLHFLAAVRVILSLRIIQLFILFMTQKSVNIHTKKRIPDIQHKKGVKRNYLVVVCSRHLSQILQRNFVLPSHESIRRASLNLITPSTVASLLTLSSPASLKIPQSAAQSLVAFYLLSRVYWPLSLSPCLHVSCIIFPWHGRARSDVPMLPNILSHSDLWTKTNNH